MNATAHEPPYWGVRRDPIFTWQATFDYTRIHPEQLLWWTLNAIRVLSLTGLYRVTCIPELCSSSQAEGSDQLCERINQRFEQNGILDLLYFSQAISSGRPGCGVSTLLNYVRSGKVVAVDCYDITGFRRSLEPNSSLPDDDLPSRMTLEISGALYRPGDLKFPTVNVCRIPAQLYVMFRTYTDLWLPAVFNWHHNEDASTQIFPNRELSALNAPRLNLGLGQLRELTLSVDGTWEIEETYRHHQIGFDMIGVKDVME